MGFGEMAERSPQTRVNILPSRFSLVPQKPRCPGDRTQRRAQVRQRAFPPGSFSWRRASRTQGSINPPGGRLPGRPPRGRMAKVRVQQLWRDPKCGGRDGRGPKANRRGGGDGSATKTSPHIAPLFFSPLRAQGASPRFFEIPRSAYGPQNCGSRGYPKLHWAKILPVPFCGTRRAPFPATRTQSPLSPNRPLGFPGRSGDSGARREMRGYPPQPRFCRREGDQGNLAKGDSNVPGYKSPQANLNLSVGKVQGKG
jgi:hypothetical protein